jgi:hypothetical protein
MRNSVGVAAIAVFPFRKVNIESFEGIQIIKRNICYYWFHGAL